MKEISFASICALVLGLSGAASAGTLTVQMGGFSDDAGLARIVVMAGPEVYSGAVPVTRAAQVPILDGSATWQVHDLPHGAYALIAHHDRNANDRLDRPLFGLPLEPYGYSQGAWTSFGLPAWDAVAFTVGEAPVGKHVRMRMNAFAAFGQLFAVGAPSLAAIFAGLWIVRRRWNRTDPAVSS